ncbi:hypothetical protein PanWU01x14_198160, partial [Parasponia andersonii]
CLVFISNRANKNPNPKTASKVLYKSSKRGDTSVVPLSGFGRSTQSQNETEREGVAMMIKQIQRYTLRSIDDFVSSTFELLLL